MAPLGRRDQEVVELAECRADRPGGGDEAVTDFVRTRAAVVPHDGQPVRLGLPDPLPRLLRDTGERLVFADARPERDRQAMAGWLDLLDLVEPDRLDRRAIAGVGPDLRVRGDDVDPVLREPSSRPVEAPGEHGDRRSGRRDRPAGEARAPAADDRPGPQQDEDRRSVVADEEPGRPARPLPVGRPGTRLQDVTAGRSNGEVVPARNLRGLGLAIGRHAAAGPRRRTRSRAMPSSCPTSGIRSASDRARYTSPPAIVVRVAWTNTTTLPGSGGPRLVTNARTPTATSAAAAEATIDRTKSQVMPPRSRPACRLARMTTSAIASAHAAMAIASPSAGRPRRPTSTTPSVVLIATARIAAMTGVRVSCRA